MFHQCRVAHLPVAWLRDQQQGRRAAFLTHWRLRTKSATSVSIPRLRSIWGQNPWPTRADDEPQHELRVRVPANQSETLPLCQVGNGAFLTVICTLWALRLGETKATPYSNGPCVFINPGSSIHHCKTWTLTILKKLLKCYYVKGLCFEQVISWPWYDSG